MLNMETVAHLGDLAAVPLLEAALGLHEGRVLVPGVVVGEVRVRRGALRGGGGRGARGGRLCCGRLCSRFLLREVNGNLDISERILSK